MQKQTVREKNIKDEEYTQQKRLAGQDDTSESTHKKSHTTAAKHIHTHSPSITSGAL